MGRKRKREGSVPARRCTLSEYAHNEDEGLVKRHLSKNEPEATIAGVTAGDHVRIRSFGSDRGVVSDSESLFIEIETEKSQLTTIMDELKELRQKVLELTAFKSDTQAIAVRAFADTVLNSFLKAAKKSALKPHERHLWLMRSSGAKTYVQGHSGDFFLVRGAKVSIEPALVMKLRALRRSSSKLSIASCHSTTPLKIALALENAVLMKEVTNNVKAFKKLFKVIFGVKSASVRRKFLRGEVVEPIFLAGFKVKKF